MSIFVEKSGVLATVQDLGRTGFRRFGVNPNGAMDRTAVRLINILIGANENAAVLEMHYPAPVLRFESPAIIALGAANFGATLDGEPFENWRLIRVEKNQILKFTEKISGSRVYLTVGGGFEINRWLGSTSTNLAAGIGGFDGRSLTKGDRLFFRQMTGDKKRKTNYKISKSLIPHYSALPTIRVVEGAEFKNLTARSAQNFLQSNFTISLNSDRMGFRLHGEPLHLPRKTETISAAVDFGTIQLLPDGQMVILMADHQTSGGYPRIAHVATVDLPVLAQLGANDQVGFQMISLPEAENLTLQFEKDLRILRIGVNSKYVFD